MEKEMNTWGTAVNINEKNNQFVLQRKVYYIVIKFQQLW